MLYECVVSFLFGVVLGAYLVVEHNDIEKIVLTIDQGVNTEDVEPEPILVKPRIKSGWFMLN